MSFLFSTVASSTSTIALTEVVVQALSSEAYNVTRANENALHAWMSPGLVLCQGQIFTASSASRYADLLAFEDDDTLADSSLHFLVKTTSPTLKGRVVESTKVYVVPPVQDGDERHSVSIKEPTVHEEPCEIDEGFLGSSVLSPMNATRAMHRQYLLATIPSLVPSSEDYSIYVQTAELSQIGVLSGDWVISRYEGGSSCRLVRIKADDSLASEAERVYVSPVLGHNLIGRPITLERSRVSIYSTPFGSGHPTIPTARTLTIARLASPVSIHRTYQPISLSELHEYFRSGLRLMKKGDIVALPIDTDYVHSVSAGQAEEEKDTEGPEFEHQRSPVLMSANEVAYFIVTNVESEVLPFDDDDAGDYFTGIKTGEWGCWVDPATTRIVQTGVEHARVPNVLEYFGINTLKTISRPSLFRKLLSLVSASLTPNAIEYGLQLSIILKGARGTGKLATVHSVARHLGMHVLELNCYDLLGDNDIQTEGTLRARFEKASSCSPCILVLRYVDALSQTTQNPDNGKGFTMSEVLSECIDSLEQSWTLTGFPVVVVATTNRTEETPSRMMACFKHELEFNAPEEEERQNILRSLVQDIPLAPDVSLKEFAVQTAALVASDLTDLIARGKHAYLKRTMGASGYTPASLQDAGTVLGAVDLELALARARASYSESIGAPKIPNVSWDDVGGLASVKADILDTIQLPLEHPELFSHGLKKRSGILLYGPPGTGKTLLAKAVATSCALNFFSVKGPELLNMYIGESEANVRRVFQRARDAKPCVIFFDELDSVAPKRGAHGDSGGVMDRIVSQLLAELDGVAGGDSGADVFVIGATNRPDLLDPALLRPGRFDRMLYLGVSQTHEAQLNILYALTRKFKLHPDLSLQHIAAACPFHYTGADFYALCSDALLNAMSRKAEELEAKIAVLNASPVDPRHPYPLTPQYYLAEIASPEEIEVLVSQSDFESALNNLIPSVSQAEMEHYARVQQQFSKETINSSTS